MFLFSQHISTVICNRWPRKTLANCEKKYHFRCFTKKNVAPLMIGVTRLEPSAWQGFWFDSQWWYLVLFISFCWGLWFVTGHTPCTPLHGRCLPVLEWDLWNHFSITPIQKLWSKIPILHISIIAYWVSCENPMNLWHRIRSCNTMPLGVALPLNMYMLAKCIYNRYPVIPMYEGILAPRIFQSWVKRSIPIGLFHYPK